MTWVAALVVMLVPVALGQETRAPSTAHLVADSIVIRVTSAKPGVVRVHGIVATNDSATHRRLENAPTPVEIRIPGTTAHAIFRSVDDGWLEGEIFLLRNGKAHPRAYGRVARAVMMYVRADGEVGFAGVP